ncbi:MAG TPA: hypothetical protein VIS05_04025 [Ilumatobacter sp.]
MSARFPLSILVCGAVLTALGCSGGSREMRPPGVALDPPTTLAGLPGSEPAPGSAPVVEPPVVDTPVVDTPPGTATPTQAAHPLDGLTAGEIETFREVLVAAGRYDGSDFAYLALADPPKDEVLSWEPGAPLARHAFAVVRRDGRTFEAVVDLATRELVSWTEMPGALTGFVSSEFGTGPSAARADARFVAALARRGLAVDDVSLSTFAGGAANGPDELGRRLARVVPFRREGDGPRLSRPVEGVVATVDLDTGEVLSVLDADPPVTRRPVAPVPDAARQRPPLDPVTFTASGAGNLVLDGSGLSWSGWSLRWRANVRTGIELADVRFDAGTGARRVLYEGYLADLFVPYQDPDPAWSFRTLLDSADFGMGATMSSLQPDVDCPATATFLDVVLPDDRAEASTRPAALCVFERPTGNPAYLHAGDGELETELVMRWVAVVGNYDYVVDNVFVPDGSMRFHVFAAGIVLQKGTDSADAAAADDAGDHDHGVIVGEGLLAVNHDHYMSFRLDLDIDGTANRLVRQDLVAEPVADTPGRTMIWKLVEQTVPAELAATYTPDPKQPARMLVQSSAADGPLGHHPGYEVEFGDSAAVARPEQLTDPGMRRGGWAGETLWVTPNSPVERFASGLYVPDGTAEAGLARWVQQDRTLVDADLVVWFTMGFHHIVRTEDLPNMPAHEGSLGLKPVNVYATNPLVP